MGLMLLWARGCECFFFWKFLLDPLGMVFKRLIHYKAVVAYYSFRIVFAVLYWYLWTVAVPRWRGYRLEEEVDGLEDGTSITKLIRVKDN